jgi:Spy/CpxP family protein refolding chaperone
LQQTDNTKASMKLNKYSLAGALALSALLAWSSPIRAEEKIDTKAGPRDAKSLVVQSTLKRMTKELDLTEPQQGKIRPFLEEQSDKISAVRDDERIPIPEKGPKFKEIRAATHAKIKTILTAEQSEKWENMYPKKTRE